MGPFYQQRDFSYEQLLCDRDIGKTLSRIDEALFPMVASIENRDAGNTFGKRVDDHMKELAEEGPSLAASMGLSLREGKLLTVLLRSHDVGRIVCEHEKPGDKIFQYSHGSIGRDFLEANGLLGDLSESDRVTLLLAVEQHSAKVMDLPPDSLEEKLCRILRDMDKASILESPRFTSPVGVIQQYLQWMSSEGEKEVWNAIKDREIASDILDWIDEFFVSERPTHYEDLTFWKTLDAGEKGFLREISSKLTGEILPDHFDRCLNRESLTYDEMLRNYPTYMLGQLVLIFDISSSPIVSKLRGSQSVQARLHYLRLRGGEFGNSLADSIESYLA